METVIPFEKRIWDASAVADYLGVSYDSFMKRDRYRGGFPDPLPAFEGKHPRWSAQAVTDWALAIPLRENHASEDASA